MTSLEVSELALIQAKDNADKFIPPLNLYMLIFLLKTPFLN